MKSHYSIIKYVNNSLTNETISLGLIVISNNEIYFHLSPNKIELVKKLNSKNYKLLEFSLKQFKHFAEKETKEENSELFSSVKIIDFEYLNRLSNYNNGILQFSKPESIDSIISYENFLEYVKKFIGEDLMIPVRMAISPFKEIIKEKLYEPLQDKIDVDFILKKHKLESLFFDFHFDCIGVNGALYAAKAIDFNANRQLGQIRTDISEFESVIERLNRFAQNKGLSNNNTYCLIVDSYKGNQPSYNDLYSLLKKDIMPLFKIIESTEVEKFTSKVISHKARKFSEELELV